MVFVDKLNHTAYLCVLYTHEVNAEVCLCALLPHYSTYFDEILYCKPTLEVRKFYSGPYQSTVTPALQYV